MGKQSQTFGEALNEKAEYRETKRAVFDLRHHKIDAVTESHSKWIIGCKRVVPGAHYTDGMKHKN